MAPKLHLNIRRQDCEAIALKTTTIGERAHICKWRADRRRRHRQKYRGVAIGRYARAQCFTTGLSDAYSRCSAIQSTVCLGRSRRRTPPSFAPDCSRLCARASKPNFLRRARTRRDQHCYFWRRQSTQTCSRIGGARAILHLRTFKVCICTAAARAATLAATIGQSGSSIFCAAICCYCRRHRRCRCRPSTLGVHLQPAATNSQPAGYFRLTPIVRSGANRLRNGGRKPKQKASSPAFFAPSKLRGTKQN